LAAELPETEIRIVLISFADGRTQGLPVGAYLASYNPEGDGGNGIATWTRDPAQAMTFATGDAATACYRAGPRRRGSSILSPPSAWLRTSRASSS
jgi:hypothetical protein